MRLLRPALALLLILPLLSAAQGQIPASDPATVELVREAVANLTEEGVASHRFTYRELAHTENRDAKGKLFYKRTVLSETIYIGGLPFERYLEVDGKALAGKALEEEQARYNAAVDERRALDTATRSRLDHQHFVDAGVPYGLLTTHFQLVDARQEELGGRTARVIEATPLPGQNARRIVLWIAPGAGPGVAPTLLRTEFTYLVDDGEVERGSSGWATYTVADGVPLPDHKELHARIHLEGKRVQVDVERSYSDYQRFRATVRVLPGEDKTPR